MQPSAVRGFLYVLFSVCVWSGWMVASRFAVKGSLSVADITEIRFFVSGIILLPVVLKRGFAVGTKGVFGGLALTVLLGAPYTYIAVSGMRFAPASHAATLINGSMLLCATLIGILQLKEPTTRLRLFGVACSLGGILTLLARSDAGASPFEWMGHALFITAGVMWALYAVLVRVWKANPLHTAAVLCVWSLFLYTPFYLIFEPHHIGWENAREVAFQAVYQGLLTAVLALISFNRAISILGASRASSLLPMVPVLASLLAIVFLHEVPPLAEWAGIAAVSVGVLFASGVIAGGRKAVAAG